MAGTIKRTHPGDAANSFVRCILSDIGDMLGGFSNDDLNKTVEFFDYKCPYTGESIEDAFKKKEYVLDHLIPHNKESCGLHLFGNIVVTTRKINSEKAAKSFEDFIMLCEGTKSEKEARIKKLKDFQERSGYLEKTKNLDKLKQFCKSEYMHILQILEQNKSKYSDIMGTSRLVPKQMRKQISKNNLEKHEIIDICRKNGILIHHEFTKSKLNAGAPKYWANPNKKFLKQTWWLVLVNTDERELHVFEIPGESIQEKQMKYKNKDLIDLQIYSDRHGFIDSRSGISFLKWHIKTIVY